MSASASSSPGRASTSSPASLAARPVRCADAGRRGAWVGATLEREYDGGDHTIVLGRVPHSGRTRLARRCCSTAAATTAGRLALTGSSSGGCQVMPA